MTLHHLYQPSSVAELDRFPQVELDRDPFWLLVLDGAQRILFVTQHLKPLSIALIRSKLQFFSSYLSSLSFFLPS